MAEPMQESLLRDVYTVSRLNLEARAAIESSFPPIWVQGEISQIRTPGSGHAYLTLKDDRAVLPAVIWRSTLTRMRFVPEEGQAVIVRGGIDVYPPHGRYQLIVRRVEPVGAARSGARKIDIVGPVCESGDFIAKDRSFPTVEDGDLLAVRSAGAYGFCMSSNYNGRPRAAEVLVRGDEYAVVRERESLEDLVRGETVPDGLVK